MHALDSALSSIPFGVCAFCFPWQLQPVFGTALRIFKRRISQSHFFPTCEVRVVGIFVRCPAPPSSLLASFLPPRRTSSASSCLQWTLAEPHLPALDRSDIRRTSSASSESQLSSPDLFCQHLIAVGLARPQLLAGDRSGPRRTSTGESLSAVGLAGPQPARV